MARTAVDPDIPIVVSPEPGPYSARLADSVVALIRQGLLLPGQRLPSTRLLAVRLGVSRGTVMAAYDELAAAGYVQAVPGGGTTVAPDAPAAASAGAAIRTRIDSPAERDPVPGQTAPDVRWDLTPGRPDTTLISTRAWRRAWRLAADEPIHDAQGGPLGHSRLRRAVSDHLRRHRGLSVAAEEIFVVPGVNSALRNLAAALAIRGHPVAMEDPGYRAARDVLTDAGSTPIPVPVDDDGLVIDALPESARLLYVTPAHQYPLGGRLPVGRRAALLAWVRRVGAMVVEDDYDGEFRYDVPPLPALATLDGGRDLVAYVGTFSKTLAPELRVAWVVPPRWLLDGFRTALSRSEDEVPRMVGAALTRMLTEGAIGTHLARARRRYAARRAAFVTAVTKACPEITILGVEAGLHAVLRLPDKVDDAAISRDLAQLGLLVPSLTDYRFDPAHGPRGLLCGYARLAEHDAAEVAATLARALRDWRR